MQAAHTVDEPAEAGAPETGVTPELLDRLRPYLAESIMVLDADWTVKANLAPPGGLIGRGLGLGVHTLEDMHPDDAIMVMDLGMQAFSTEAGWQGSKIVRMRTGDGTYGRYEITAINRFDDPVIDGMVVRTRELPHDVTEDVTGIERTSAIETLAEMLPLGVLLLDKNGRVVFANDNACGMLGRDPEILKRDGFEPTLSDNDRQITTEILRRVLAEPGYERCTVQLVAGHVERAEYQFTSEGAPGEVSCVVVTIEDVTQRDAEHRVLEARANHDPLTGLLNRAALHELLDDRLAREEPTMVAYLDLDGFKAVNDTWGHERGDQLLVAVAQGLAHACSPEDEIARLGGDEFVVVTDPQHSYEVLGNRLRDAVTGATRGDHQQVTGSIGLAVSQAGDSCHDILRRADHAMYAAKSRRRA
ncbi:diguanylate cyclase domain-containing protein [Aquihabitans daechungensis]|uniref:sensor domain-containing diguanylate cyclase n=1 Tax=Aquihabitans daechungensis TaxID=1052257 RepID=UPI003BA1A260